MFSALFLRQVASTCVCQKLNTIPSLEIIKRTRFKSKSDEPISSSESNTMDRMNKLDKVKNSNNIDGSARRNMFMVVGLGNQSFPETRHSIGMKAVDQLASRLGLQWQKTQGRLGGSVCKSVLNLSDDTERMAQIFLFKPKDLMNISGKNVARTAKLLGLKADKIYLVHDELDLPVGKCGLKHGGSSRGHRGVQSCISSLKSSGLWLDETSTGFKGMPRLRIGIGRPKSKSDVVSYVLDLIPSEDLKAVVPAIERGMDLVLQHIAARVVKTDNDESGEHEKT